jgi:hypothetical protein
MNLSNGGLPKGVPRRFPIGATYVVEGYGGEQGQLRVISRYVVLPGGCRINVPGSMPLVPARAITCRRDPNPKQSRAESRPRRARKKFAARAGTR